MKLRLFALFFVVGSLAANATSVDFSGLALGTAAPFSVVNSDLTTSFTNAEFSTNGYGSASIETAITAFGGVYVTPLVVGNSVSFQQGNGLDISFSQSVAGVSFDEISASGEALPALQAFLNGVPVATTVTVSNQSEFNYSDPQQSVQVSGLFNSLELGSSHGGSSTTYVGALAETAAPQAPVSATPEPSTIGMFSAASLLIGLGAWRFKKNAVA